MQKFSTHFDVIGIGNAIVDILVRVDESFLAKYSITKGKMNLITGAESAALYKNLPEVIQASGGSVANSMAGVASLGGQAAYIGKVKDDQLGQFFRHDIQAAGVAFTTSLAKTSSPTATSQILITPDGERSMQTYLGACVELDSGDINQEAIQSAKICYLEGYLWDPPKGREALYKAAQTAKSAGRQVALTLSDAWLVDRHRQDFREFIHEAVDILFANELELLSLYETEDFNQALELIRGTVAIAAITRSEKGSILLKRAETHLIPAEKTQIVDTTGAGDLYAAGVLFGLSQGMDLKICGRLGSIAAAEVISHIGPRPQVNLKELAKSKQALAA